MGWLVAQNPHPALKTPSGSKLRPIPKKIRIAELAFDVCVPVGNTILESASSGSTVFSDDMWVLMLFVLSLGDLRSCRVVFVKRPP